MNRRLWMMAALGALLGVALGVWHAEHRDALNHLFPADKLQGFEQGTQIFIDTNLTSKTITGGAILIAQAITPGAIPPDRLGPTCLGVLKSLLLQRPHTDWICVFVAEDTDLAATSNWLAEAEYHRGRVTLRGGPPTPRQIDSLRSLGLGVHHPTPAEAALINAAFEAMPGLKADRWQLSQSLRGPSTANLDRETCLNPELETHALYLVGKSHGMNEMQVRDLVLAVTRYYWLRAGIPWTY